MAWHRRSQAAVVDGQPKSIGKVGQQDDDQDPCQQYGVGGPSTWEPWPAGCWEGAAHKNLSASQNQHASRAIRSQSKPPQLSKVRQQVLS